ncbi:hypothetical protein LINPERHAP1_LOCUS5001, partial [Linum perenne]
WPTILFSSLANEIELLIASTRQPSPWNPASAVTTASTVTANSFATASSAAALNRVAAVAGHVNRLGAAVVGLLDDVLDLFVLSEAEEALGLDGGLVNEEILAAVVGGDEAVPLLVVEPLNLAGQSL